jgi:hypothetical protein
MRETHGENISFTAWTNSGEYQVVDIAIAGFPGKRHFQLLYLLQLSRQQRNSWT